MTGPRRDLELGVTQRQLVALLRDELHARGTVALRAHGHSMWPAIPDGAVVTLSPVDSATVRVGQVVCFEQEGRVRLHRVLAFDVHGHAVVGGDNLQHADGAVAPQQLLATVVDAPSRRAPSLIRRLRWRIGGAVRRLSSSIEPRPNRLGGHRQIEIDRADRSRSVV